MQLERPCTFYAATAITMLHVDIKHIHVTVNFMSRYLDETYLENLSQVCAKCKTIFFYTWWIWVARSCINPVFFTFSVSPSNFLKYAHHLSGEFSKAQMGAQPQCISKALIAS